MYFDQTLFHKVFNDIVSSVYLPFITFFFEEMFSQSRNFYENNMILWYYQNWPKVVWKVHGAWIDGYDSRAKTKSLPLRKIRVYNSKNHVIPYPVVAAILTVILNILER